MADFTGFYFNNIHSSTYHLYRTSNGSRFEKKLIPEFDDRSVPLVGEHGDLYEGRRFKPVTFSVPIAFDSVTEEDLKNIKIWLSGEELKPFQYDDEPYKTYYVKPASVPDFSFICFSQENNFGDRIRVYKGEGTIQFIAYSPFGYCVDESTEIIVMDKEVDGHKVLGINYTDKINRQSLDSYTSLNYTHGDDFLSHPVLWQGNYLFGVGENTQIDLNLDNTVEWAGSSGLLHSNILQNYNTFTAVKADGARTYEQKDNNYAPLYNPGDMETNFMLYFDLENKEEIPRNSENAYRLILQIDNGNSDTPYYKMSFKFDGIPAYAKVLLNTKNHSLSIWNEETNRWDMRYDIITSVYNHKWFKIPRGLSRIIFFNDSAAPSSDSSEETEQNSIVLDIKPYIKYSYMYY